jgi:probable rRNA maturation factor
MINFNYETDFELNNEEAYSKWLLKVITSEGKSLGDIDYIFCDDEYLLKLNVEFLQHDTLTDIISFDYSVGDEIHGQIYISIERVRENAIDYNVTFVEELQRVMAHGVLHYCGYKDKTDSDADIMRAKENDAINLF